MSEILNNVLGACVFLGLLAGLAFVSLADNSRAIVKPRADYSCTETVWGREKHTYHCKWRDV